MRIQTPPRAVDNSVTAWASPGHDPGATFSEMPSPQVIRGRHPRILLSPEWQIHPIFHAVVDISPVSTAPTTATPLFKKTLIVVPLACTARRSALRAGTGLMHGRQRPCEHPGCERCTSIRSRRHPDELAIGRVIGICRWRPERSFEATTGERPERPDESMARLKSAWRRCPRLARGEE